MWLWYNKKVEVGSLSVRNNQVERAVYLEWRVKRFELHI
nr:MAG TPA: hypothetical protein [Caudoviricetes sp.]